MLASLRPVRARICILLFLSCLFYAHAPKLSLPLLPYCVWHVMLFGVVYASLWQTKSTPSFKMIVAVQPWSTVERACASIRQPASDGQVTTRLGGLLAISPRLWPILRIIFSFSCSLPDACARGFQVERPRDIRQSALRAFRCRRDATQHSCEVRRDRGITKAGGSRPASHAARPLGERRWAATERSPPAVSIVVLLAIPGAGCCQVGESGSQPPREGGGALYDDHGRCRTRPGPE